MLSISCERDDFSTSPSLKLGFSQDTVMFDTVFTTIGSSTRLFKVYNRNKHDLKISSIQLAGGNSSFFRINIDGIAADQVEDVTIRKHDSLFVFVEVTVDPLNQNSPLFISYSVVFITNVNTQNVKLAAWGQDVHLLNAKTIEVNTALGNDKPYLVYDYLFIKPDVELNINEGVKIHFHNRAQLVVAGTLRVNGTYDNPVIFQGDRLEDFYKDKAGQWGGVWLYGGSKNNIISWAQIRNSINGLIVDTCVTTSSPTLRMSNTIIENSSSVGLYARGSKIIADNCLFSNSGLVSVALTMGGAYQFYQCTIANYWGQYIYRQGPALLLNNYYLYQVNNTGPVLVEPRDLDEAFFANCIIYGSRDSEFEIDNSYKDQLVQAAMNYKFENCILKVPNDFNLSDISKYTSVSRKDPKFKNSSKLDFQLDTLSPAKDFGLFMYGQQYPIDLKNTSHLVDSKPDLGAYERVE